MAVVVGLMAPADAGARTLNERTAIAAAESRATPGELISGCERVNRVRMDCWLLAMDLAEIVDDETGESTPIPVEIYMAVFYRRGRLFTYMPLTDDRAVVVRKLMPRRERLRIRKATGG